MSYHVTLIGSFRKDQDKLQDIYNKLAEKFTLLSPESISFTSDENGFVKTDKELEQSISEIENKHLNAIKQSDFVVLHAPDGYVGNSASLEIGFAYALGIPILADETPHDATIAAMITGVLGKATDESPVYKAGKGIGALQSYYLRAAERRGWNEESARDTMLLLIEEIGELARAVRKDTGLKRDAGYENVSVADELADVQLYLVHLANTLNLDLSDAVTRKEMKNAERYQNKNLGN